MAANSDNEPPTEPILPVLPQGLSSLMPVPVKKPLRKETVELGRKLFFDGTLSADGTVSCATCHDPKLAFAERREVSIGIDGQPGRRNAPSLFNAAYRDTLFWDGRAGTLEAQALMPITNSMEMGNTLPTVINRLSANSRYRAHFLKAFGSREINSERLTQALAAFQRTLVSGDSPFDRYARGDEEALSKSARRGLELFRGKARCSRCHEGNIFTDEQFHNTGVSWGKKPIDLGRFEHTGSEEDKGKFMTPSLRNVALTPPYMHDGSLANLREVIEFYNQGGQANPNLDRTLRPLHLNEPERANLRAFLEALTSETLAPIKNGVKTNPALH